MNIEVHARISYRTTLEKTAKCILPKKLCGVWIQVIGLFQAVSKSAWCKLTIEHRLLCRQWYSIVLRRKQNVEEHGICALLQWVTIGIYQVSMPTVNFCIFNMSSFKYFTHSFASRQCLLLLFIIIWCKYPSWSVIYF
jgi:hypothetical protein